jgi:hypothetical protein
MNIIIICAFLKKYFNLQWIFNFRSNSFLQPGIGKPQFLFLFFVIFLSQYVSAGWYIVEKSEDRFGNFSYQSTFIQDGFMRIENEQSIFILDLKSERITLVFPQKMGYWTGNHDSLRESVISAVETQLNTMIAQLPEKERIAAQIEYDTLLSAMKSDTIIHQLPEQIVIRKNDNDTVLCGFQSIGYDVVVDSAIYEKIWITNEVTPYKPTDIKQIARMTRVFTKPSLVTFYRTSENWYQLLQHGMVMKSVVITPIGESVTRVDSMKEINIPPAFFEAPPDYRSIGIDELILITMGDEKPADTKPKASTQQPGMQDLYSLPEPK